MSRHLRNLLPALLLAGSVSAQTQSSIPRATSTVAASAQDSVWATVLAGPSSSPVLLIRDSTGLLPRFGTRDTTGLAVFEEFVSGLDARMVADFITQTSRRMSVSIERLRAAGLRGAVATITSDELRRATEIRGGGLRFRRFPGSEVVMSVSRVGFDATRQNALVHVSWYCGARCGGTSLYLLSRDSDGVWRVAHIMQGLIALNRTGNFGEHTT